MGMFDYIQLNLQIGGVDYSEEEFQTKSFPYPNLDKYIIDGDEDKAYLIKESVCVESEESYNNVNVVLYEFTGVIEFYRLLETPINGNDYLEFVAFIVKGDCIYIRKL